MTATKFSERNLAITPDRTPGAGAAIGVPQSNAVWRRRIISARRPCVGAFDARHRARRYPFYDPSQPPSAKPLLAGGLLAYGTSQVESIRRMAVYVDKVLKGANPGELSVERVTPYELVVNLNTARDIGITVPREVLKRADRVIQ